MPYNEELAERLKPILAGAGSFDEKKMFGGVDFLFNGNMCCGIHREYLILRLGPEMAEQALTLEHVKVFDITGRAMKGWVMVAPAGYRDDFFVREWVQKSIDFCLTLPPK